MGRAGLRELWADGRGRVLLFCWLGWVFDFYDLILFAFLKTGVAAELQLDVSSEIAWIDGWTLAATAVGGLFFGRLADRVGRRFALSLSILIYSAGAFATAFADGFTTLLIARLITGIGVGGEWGVGHAVIAETYPAHLRNRAAGVLQAGSPVAMALAAAVGCFAGPLIGWRACFLLSGLPALLVFFARWSMPGEDRAPGRELSRVRELFSGVHARASFALLGLLVLHMTGFWCTYAWLPVHLMRDRGVSPEFVGWFQIGVNAVHVVADVAFGLLADRLGRRRMFVAFCLSFAAGLFLLSFGFEWFATDLRIFGLVLGFVGLGAGTWSCFGVLFAENYPARIRATAASGFYNLSRGVQLVTQPAIGWLSAQAGTFAVALHVGAVTAILSAVVIFAVPRVDVPDAGAPQG